MPDEAAIRAAIAERFPGLKARSKGGLNILAIYHNYNWEGPSLGPSLAAFGSVATLDWRDPSLSEGYGPDERGWKKRMNEGLLRAAFDRAAIRPFDAVFCYLSGEQVTPDTVAALRTLGAPMVNLALNDKESFVGKMFGGQAQGARDICAGFDLCWTSTFDALEKYVVEGATPLYLPEGANPALHRPYEDEKKVYDVSFVGQRYGNRPDTIAKLREAGIKVEVFGPLWPNGPLSTEEMVRTWSRSRINLGFGGVHGLKETFCLKGRDFEVPMSGGLYLTEHHEELLPFFEVGREIVTYTDFSDLLIKIKWLLANPREAEAIRLAGRARALAEHTWEMRLEKVFRLLGVVA
ncbi:MAG: glycosyltransferase [Deltaproteobacteria bacterium]|nr:glycosyltransferase [Deltaproteobacteria bacterium]